MLNNLKLAYTYFLHPSGDKRDQALDGICYWGPNLKFFLDCSVQGSKFNFILYENGLFKE